MARGAGSALSSIELLVLDHAGGDNDIGIAYGAVQLYANFQRQEELFDATEGALLRLFDLGLLRLVEAPWETGYSLDRGKLTPMTREQLVVELAEWREPPHRSATMVFYDPTPEGEAVLASVPREQIPTVSGNVHRPWLENDL